ncbi:MAG TPA: SLC13 family permease [Actinomycetota bacterium]
MSWEAWLTLAVVALVIGTVATERAPLPHALLGGLTVLLVTGVLEPEEAFAGFSNPAPLTVAALYVIARAVERTGAVEYIVSRMLGGGTQRSDRVALARVLIPTTVLSAFMNNTPVVGVMAPAVAAWARRAGRPVSRFLMPISFAALFGGILTLIGTSTNLVVAGLMREEGIEPLGLFEITRVGLPLAVVALPIIALMAPVVLPLRRAPGEQLSTRAREFTVEMQVDAGGALEGKSVADAGLRSLQGVFLVAIDRDGIQRAPVQPENVLRGGDRLVFAGNVDRILDLQRTPGLSPAEGHHFADFQADHGNRFYEIVVSAASPVAGSTLKEAGFRARYGAAVVAIHRAGEQIPGKLGEVTIHAGDVLILVADGGWGRRWRDHHDFLVVGSLGEGPPLRKGKARIVAVVMGLMLIAAGTELLDILTAALVAALSLVALRVITRTQARDAVDLEVVVAIGASFGIGSALASTGLAATFAEGIVDAFSPFGDTGVLIGLLVATMALTSTVTNNAAAVLMFPIALATAAGTGIDVRPLAVAVTVAASVDFVTPIGYQTNTMVYGMGGYRWGDFVRLGGVLTVVMLIGATILIPLGWPLRP